LKSYIGKNKSNLSAMKAALIRHQSKLQKQPPLPVAEIKVSPMKHYNRNSCIVASSSESVDFEEMPRLFSCYSKKNSLTQSKLAISSRIDLKNLDEHHICSEEAQSLQEQEEQPLSIYISIYISIYQLSSNQRVARSIIIITAPCVGDQLGGSGDKLH